jgi:tRNA-2-methylthio-N6-dimethylallyladenosine synthase
MGTKLYIKTYGCQMNEYDSQKTLEILKKDPAIEETDNPNDADIILLNTCSIREKAEEKVYSELGRLNKLKKINPNLKLELVAVLLLKKEKIFTNVRLM